MSTNDFSPENEVEAVIRDLYETLITSWNERSAGSFADLFTDTANVVGFDGSMMDGQAAIRAEMIRIFNNHKTAPYYTIVKEVRFLTPDCALLRAIVGMIPPGQNDIDPDTNAIQSMVAVKRNDTWLIELFQNTPAQFHGRPELVESFTEELRSLYA